MIKKDIELFDKLLLEKETKALFIAGPTAVGKTNLSYELAQRYPAAIINGDVSQTYTPLTIGTAKPHLPHKTISHYLFNLFDSPQDWNVMLYRKACQKLVTDLNQADRLPIIVGGSLFYVQSLFYEPAKFEKAENISAIADRKYSWQMLKSIDSVRAEQISPQDYYRIKRALDIWYDTGQLPSSKTSEFAPVAQKSFFIFLTRDKEELYDNIQKRTVDMLQSGWIEEVKNLAPEWREFIRRKKPIGYSEIDKYIETNSPSFNELVSIITIKTWQYAKRQLTYWRMLKNTLKDEKNVIINEVNLTFSSINLYLEQLKKPLDLFLNIS